MVNKPGVKSVHEVKNMTVVTIAVVAMTVDVMCVLVFT